MTTTTPHPADALPLPEPLVLLHTGDDFGGERGDPELEFNSFDAATEYCTQRPPKMEVGLHPDDAIRAAHREGYELAMSKRVADVDECKRLANVYANAWVMVHDTPRDSSLIGDRQEQLTGACKDLHAAIDALASQPAQEQPAWVSGEPVNLVAAAKDADEWLALIQRLNDSGRWKFGEPDSRSKLDGCRAALQKMLAQQAAAVPAGDDWATIAGLESSVGHLSALVDEQRALLAEAENVFGRDGHGGQYEDGECELIDRIRAHLEMIAAPAAPPAPVLPLSDEQRMQLFTELYAVKADNPSDMFKLIVQAVEKAHGITAHGAGGESTT